MNDEAPSTQADSGKSQRRCRWCGKDISHRKKIAKHCSDRCKERTRKSKWSELDQKRHRERCRWRYAQNSEEYKRKRRDYVEANKEKVRECNAYSYKKNRAANQEKQRSWTENMKRNRPDEYRDFLNDQRVRYRRRAAERAMSILLLPVQQPPEA